MVGLGEIGVSGEAGRGTGGKTSVLGRRLFLIWAFGLVAVYALTLRPTIGWNDSPEFVDVAHTLGIGHPPGFPTYALLGKLAGLLPAGSVAARVNLLSLFCGVGGVVLLALCVGLLHRRFGGSPTAGRVAGMACGSLLALSPTYWNFATHAEVYAPLAMVVALLVFLALRWAESGDDRYLLGGAFVFGLSGGIHGTTLFFTPALAFLVLTGIPRGRRLRMLLRIAFFGILGASVYLYLPIRAATEPAFNWGHPDTWERFLSHVMDRKDADFHFTGGAQPWWPFIKVFAGNLNAEVTVVGWLLALSGLVITFVRSARWGVFTVLFCLGNLLFFLTIWTIPDAYLPTFWFVALWAGIATARIFDLRPPLRRLAVPATALAITMAIALLVRDGAVRATSRIHDGPRSAVAANLLPLDENAIVFVTANWFAMRYLQDVEGARPDVSILLVSDLTSPTYFTPVTPVRFPKIDVPEGGDDQEQWEAFFQELLRRNLGRHPVYWEPLRILNPGVYPYLRPWLYLWRFNPEGVVALSREEADAYFKRIRTFLGREFEVPGLLDDIDAARYHAYLLSVSGDVLKLQGRPQDAVVVAELADSLSSNDTSVSNELGRLYSGLSRWEDAERMFRRAASKNMSDPVALLNVAILQISLGRLEEAAATIAEAKKMSPGAPEPYEQLFALEKKRGRIEAARTALQNAIARARDDSHRAELRAALDRIDSGEES